jgi:hypothetical protein
MAVCIHGALLEKESWWAPQLKVEVAAEEEICIRQGCTTWSPAVRIRHPRFATPPRPGLALVLNSKAATTATGCLPRQILIIAVLEGDGCGAEVPATGPRQPDRQWRQAATPCRPSFACSSNVSPTNSVHANAQSGRCPLPWRLRGQEILLARLQPHRTLQLAALNFVAYRRSENEANPRLLLGNQVRSIC